MNHFSVNLVVPRIGARTVMVSASTRIARLFECFADKDIELVYQGQILDAQNTVDTYGMKPNDCVIAIAIGVRSLSARQTWINITRDSNDFAARVSACLSGSARREVVRLRDLELMRRESRPRRVVKSHMPSISEEKSGRRLGSMTSIPSSPTAISVRPLPCPWSK
jgi:hypothetical protein